MVAVDTIYVPAGKSAMPMEQVPDAETFASSGVILKVASVARTLSVPEITVDR